MSRQPKARTKVLEAARKIVQESGAGALTFDELSRVSGVTRGGITYHFPTKDALLRGLLEHDMEQWQDSEEACTPKDCPCPQRAELIGFIRSHTSRDENRRRFVAGMLSAAVHEPELLDACRAEIRDRFAGQKWDEAGLRAYLLRSAAIGMFWDEVFQFDHLPPKARKDLIALMERLAEEWTSADAATASAPVTPKPPPQAKAGRAAPPAGARPARTPNTDSHPTKNKH
ncbi:MAG: TetR/AcrR family transcriptional regulator [Xanthomonadales bacterium]|nr:TetR/AcrR family transcriptional regulator [Xanthomonadales bacterium]